MGGGSVSSSLSSTEDASLSLLSKDLPHESINSSVSSGDEECFTRKLESGSVVDGVSTEFPDSGPCISSINDATERQRSKVYAEVLSSYEQLQSRIDRLDEAKNKILSYTPGSWAEKAGDMDIKDYDVPNVTSLLLIGPKGSGKSSLVNKISRALEDDIFLLRRAQVSYNSSAGEGTYFLHEYKIPRDLGSFCLYDTRSLSADSSENMQMLKTWMTKGVCHGRMVRRKSDSVTLKAQLKCKAQRRSYSSQHRAVNFVIFVVNGLDVLESMDCADEKKKQYSQMIATNFNNPLLSFKDDKPVVVVTHGDLLPISDRVRVRVYLGELLGVPPTTQIFDIPDINDSATTLAIVDTLTYCLDRADRNLPAKDLFLDKVHAVASLLIWFTLAVLIVFGSRYTHPPKPPSTPMILDWHKIRHLWLG